MCHQSEAYCAPQRPWWWRNWTLTPRSVQLWPQSASQPAPSWASSSCCCSLWPCSVWWCGSATGSERKATTFPVSPTHQHCISPLQTTRCQVRTLTASFTGSRWNHFFSSQMSAEKKNTRTGAEEGNSFSYVMFFSLTMTSCLCCLPRESFQRYCSFCVSPLVTTKGKYMGKALPRIVDSPTSRLIKTFFE